jgi:hypothetical protein
VHSPFPKRPSQNPITLYCGDSTRPLAVVVPDDLHDGLFRIRFDSGQISDLTNLVRAKDAAVSIADCHGKAFRWQAYATEATGSPPMRWPGNSDPEPSDRGGS